MPLLTFRGVCGSALLAVSVAACGGAAFSSRDDTSEGGSGNTSGNPSKGGTSSTAGKPSKAGASTSGGASNTGGSKGVAGSTSVAGSSGVGGGPNCEAVDCAFPVCGDGQMPTTPAGECCPRCPPPQVGCDNVMCEPVLGCPSGYTQELPLGACCQGCMPPPGQVPCPEIACPDTACPLGYIRGDRVGGCCTECVPDALFCNQHSECVVAGRPRSCCGCPEVISLREYDADVCWSSVDEPRMIPEDCHPDFVCGAICAACPPPLGAVCQDHHCVQAGP